MNPDTFCVNPWITLHAKFNEGMNPCCLFKNVFKYNTVDEYVNSEELKSIKESLVAGEKIPECVVCWNHEQRGHVSKRQRDNKTYDKIFKLLNRDLTKPANKFVEYYIRLGNYCNLRCTSCNDQYSTGWASENKKFNLLSSPAVLLSEDSDVWQNLKDHASTVGAIEFIGGEPFMMCLDQQTDLLKWLVDNNHAQHIRIKYNTNGTRLPTEQLLFWSKFKAVELNISVDGIGKQFEYLRFPAKWDELNSNVRFYQNLRNNVPNLELTIITTVSILNIGYIEEILDYCQSHDLKLFLNMLDRPAVLNLYNFDVNIKSWIASRIQHIDHPVIKNIVENLNQQVSTGNGRSLLNFLEPLDQRRNLDMSDTFPELIKFLRDNSN
jgi:organic radical activating enzyme